VQDYSNDAQAGQATLFIRIRDEDHDERKWQQPVEAEAEQSYNQQTQQPPELRHNNLLG